MIEKLRKIYSDTIKDGQKYEGSLKNLPFCDLIIKATSEQKNFGYGINNLCMFKYMYYNRDSILIIFAIPIQSNEDKRNINERFFDILADVEKAFVTLNYRQLKELKEDKYMYFICVKIIENEEDELI
jgi:hypothetical protein